MREAGFRITLLSAPGELSERIAQDEGVDLVEVPMERVIAPWADIISWFRIWRTLRRLRPDIVEFSTPKAGLLGLTAAFIARIPHRVYLLRGLKLERSRGLKRWLLLNAEKCTAACSQCVLCNSISLRMEAEDLQIAPDRKLRVLGAGSSRGVDVEHFSPGDSEIREQYGIAQKVQVLGFVGRLTRDKGLPELLVAFDAILRKHPEALLLLVGWFDASEDALDSVVRDRIETHPRIFCTGYVVDPAPYYRAMDVFILPTWREGFPNAVLEAAATGIPVITTLSTGARDAVVPEVTGLLVPPGYPEAICEATSRLLRDNSLRRRMGNAARAWVTEHFVDRHILNLTIAFYKGFIGGEAPVPSRRE
ncbi:MAG: glycosyltransferase family 4 protein, partial [Acidobacteriota bacterium]|nr:glycosyltransferase family 4 protein [Acidobacteriota bacterium]